MFVAIASFFFLGAASMSNDLAGRIVLSIVGFFFLLPAILGVFMLIRKVDLFFIQDENQSFQTRLGLLENAHVLLAICDEMTSSKDEG